MKKNILLVDDDKQFCNEVKSIFDSELYCLYISGSTSEASQMIDQNKVNLLIFNVNLPDTDSVLFLKKVKQQYPLIVRTAVCDKTSENMLFRLYKNNLCKYLLEKPINKYDLAKIVSQLFSLEEKLRSKEILSTINSLDKLPVLPDTYINVNEMIDDQEDIGEIAEIIENDASMSLKILQVANSAFYRVKTGSIKTAMINLGLTNIKNIILAASIFDFFDNNSHKKRLLWKHALTTNKIVLGIYRNLLRKELSNLYSSAGMLHDIGKIILCKNYTENYMKIFDLVQDRRISFTKAEEEVLGIYNGEIGAYLLDWWDIPSPIVEAALYHETPMQSSEANRELVSVVHLASWYAWKHQNILTGEKLHEAVYENLGISKVDCDELAKKIADEIK